MKKMLRLLSPFVLCFAVQASTIASPSGTLSFGKSNTEFTLSDINGKLSSLDVDLKTSEGSFAGHATVNPDPWIDYGFALKNTTDSTIGFSFFLTTPYVGGPYSIGKSSYSGSITDSYGVTTPANASVTATVTHQPVVDATAFGQITDNCTLISGARPGDSGVCSAQNVNGIALTTGTSGFLTIFVDGTLSAGDIYTFNGFAGLSNLPSDTTVPEPGTMGLGVAAIGLAAALRKRLVA